MNEKTNGLRKSVLWVKTYTSDELPLLAERMCEVRQVFDLNDDSVSFTVSILPDIKNQPFLRIDSSGYVSFITRNGQQTPIGGFRFIDVDCTAWGFNKYESPDFFINSDGVCCLRHPIQRTQDLIYFEKQFISQNAIYLLTRFLTD